MQFIILEKSTISCVHTKTRSPASIQYVQYIRSRCELSNKCNLTDSSFMCICASSKTVPTDYCMYEVEKDSTGSSTYSSPSASTTSLKEFLELTDRFDDFDGFRLLLLLLPPLPSIPSFLAEASKMNHYREFTTSRK